ncbi:probable glutamate receptor [Scylla paramamosain]|uniref:probable glutamate receptor n=1 Tax=Scylla paramamosain TaxID=85552 RepID=UPI003083EBF0
MVAVLLYFWFLVSRLPLASTALLKIEADSWEAGAALSVREVLQASSLSHASLIVITETSFSRDVQTFLGTSRGVAMFKTPLNGSQLVQVVTRARKVRVASWMVVVVVLSDHPVFLAAFAQQAREGRLLVWATKLIVVTRRASHRLHPLHQTLALTNSLLLLVDGTAGVSRASVKAVLPFQSPSDAVLWRASWTVGHGLQLSQPLFWDKFNKFSKETNLIVAMESNERHTVVMVPDPTAPGGERPVFKGYMNTVADYLAQGLNFSYTFRRPPDGVWGMKLKNGSVIGMVGQVYREEANMALGPFAINAARYEAIDFTWPIVYMRVNVFAGRKTPEIDPWGFLLPLGPWVWAMVLAFLFLLALVSFFLSSKFSPCDPTSKNLLSFTSIMLRQSVSLGGSGWWWQRVVLGVWMLMTMVLTRSYEGNLMSLLAVRHVAQPYQTLRDVVDDPSVIMVWFKQGATMQAVMDSTSGILHEVKESEKQGRLTFLTPFEYESILNEIIDQKKVIIDYDTISSVLKTNYFSRTGRCDFYVGSETIMSNPLGFISQKDSPLIPAMNVRIMSMIEAGLYNYWRLDAAQNSSSCEREPTKITVSSSLSLRQCWAMMVVLAVGLNVGLATLCLEIVLAVVLAR